MVAIQHLVHISSETWIFLFVISSQVLLTCGDPFWENVQNSYIDINTAFINNQKQFEHDNDPQRVNNYNNNHIKTPLCKCVELQECPVALKVHTGYAGYYERHVVNNFGCGYEYYPKVCCNLIIENLLFRTHKQKRDFRSNHKRNYWSNEPTHKKKYSNHLFKWDNNGFPHWNNAPSYPTESWNNVPNENWNNYSPTKSWEDCDNERSTKKPKTKKKSTTTTSTTEAIIVYPEDEPENTDSIIEDIFTSTIEPIIEESTVNVDLDSATTDDAKRAILISQTCGSSIQNRIVGGIEARLRDFPWMARLGYNRNGVNALLFRCGGTLISMRHVLTAAHCISNLPTGLQLVTIRLGELDDRTEVDCIGTDCGEPPQDFTPERISVHPNYNTPRMSNDIGLVRLNAPARLTQFVSPLCLPFDGTPERIVNTTGLRAIVAGWGSTNTGITSASPTLQWINLTIIPFEECVLTYRNRYNMTIIESQICTAGIENMDACEGDSGGPLFVAADETRRATLIGIVSFGPRRCGTASLPGVYTRVESYLDWILTNI